MVTKHKYLFFMWNAALGSNISCCSHGMWKVYGHYDKFHGSIFSPTLRFERNYWVATAVQITSIACLLFWRYSLLCLSINPHHESWELKEIFRLLNWFETNINDHIWILFVSVMTSRKEELSPPRYQYYASTFIFYRIFFYRFDFGWESNGST